MRDDLVMRLRRLLGPTPPAPRPLGAAPVTAFEAVVETRLGRLEADLTELKGRVNGLLFLVAGAVLVQLALRMVG